MKTTCSLYGNTQHTPDTKYNAQSKGTSIRACDDIRALALVQLIAQHTKNKAQSKGTSIKDTILEHLCALHANKGTTHAAGNALKQPTMLATLYRLTQK